MDLSERAALVRAIRCELKQEAVYFVARQNEQRSRARMDARNRRQREVYGRIGERIDRGVARAADWYDRQEWAPGSDQRARVTARRAFQRMRDHGPDISPAFRRRSMDIVRASQSRNMRSAAGTGANRWRGAVAEVGRESRFRVTEAQRTADIMAQRRQDPLTQDPGSYQPTPRPRRNPPGELRTGRPQRRRRN